jgi:predicted acetyltransferase
MNISIMPVSKDEKEILRNLLEKYNYEFSQYENTDVNDLGLYGYDWLDIYWTEENRFAYFIKIDNKLAGFVMISDYKEIKIETNYSMSEFL